MKNRIKVLLALLMLCGTTQSVRAQDGGDMNNHLLRINDAEFNLQMQQNSD